MTRPLHEYSPLRDQARQGFGIRQVERHTGGEWIYVGTTLGPDGNIICDFEGSWTNMGGDWQPLRFRWLRDGNIEIEGVVTGGSAGETICILPSPLYHRRLLDDGKDLPVAGVNIADFSHAGFKIAATGEVSFEA